ncbi:MAG: hypothetical protein U0O22_10125 [Acutalibacteraceae bacterium]
MKKLFQSFRSKKGFSLAYAMVICLFLALVTGSVTTIALLQQDQTGSDLNTRQAYISAKSGLESVKNHLNNGTIKFDLSGVGEGDSRYFVLYQGADGIVKMEKSDILTGDLGIISKMEKLMDEGFSIIGGEGTYYKVTQKENGILGITSVNQTGKYNNNVTINKGDLTFDAITYTKYTVTQTSDGGEDTIPPDDDMVTTRPGSTDPTRVIGGGLNRPTQDDEPDSPSNSTTTDTSGSTTSKFLMIGQQYAYNDATLVKGDNDGSAMGLLQSYNKSNTVVWDTNEPFYQMQVETKDSDYTSHVSYFPVVYDKMVKVTSNADRSTVEAFNQGVYFCGDFKGYRNGNEYANKWSHDEYQWREAGSYVHDMGLLSYTTINTEYQASIGCNFLCIENNVSNLVRNSGNNIKHVKVYYSGTEKGYKNGKIYVYIPYGTNSAGNQVSRNITIFNCDEVGRYNGKPYDSKFTIPSGYYCFNNEFELTNIYSWYDSNNIYTDSTGALTNKSGATPKNRVISTTELKAAQDRNLYNDIIAYEKTGTLHSGGQETVYGDNNVSIINTNEGKYNSDVNGPYYRQSTSAEFKYSSYFDDAHIFISPRFSMGRNNPNDNAKNGYTEKTHPEYFTSNNSNAKPGIYRWYCGKTFNFQWFRVFDFQVPDGYNIEISAPTMVFTIGPGMEVYDSSKTYTSSNGTVTTSKSSNTIYATGSNSSFTLCGSKGVGQTYLKVMADFNVKYAGKNYVIKAGEYNNMPAALNLFSDKAKTYFENHSNAKATRARTNCIVAPGLTKQTFALSNVFANIFRSTISNSVFVANSSGDTTVVTEANINGAGTVIDCLKIPSNVETVKYLTKTTSSGEEVFKLPVKDGFRIQKEYNGTYVDYIVFKGKDADTNFNLYVPANGKEYMDLEDCHDFLYSNQSLNGSNYSFDLTGETVTQILGEYY